MPSPSAPPSAAAFAAPAAEPPARPRRVAAAWPVWRERFIGLGFLAAAAGLWPLAGRLPALPQGILWAALLLALALAMRQGWLPLFGPVFGYDLVRTTRRGRYAILRTVYAVALFLFILALYRIQPALKPGGWVGGAGGMARFAETFCYTFLAVQFLAVVALAPAYVAGAIAEEKDRKTLEFLLATDVRDREIVLGKMAARVANLALLVLTGLPILSLTQLWGGVDLGLLLAAFAGTGLTLLSLAAVSMLASVYSRKAREAVVLAYLVATGYVGLSVMAHLLNFFPRVIALPLTPGASPYTVNDLVETFNAGNPGLLCLGLVEDLRSGMTLQQALPARLGAYAVFHLLVIAVCTGWAVQRLRPLALLDGVAKVKPRAARRRRRFGWRPRLGRRPLVWKEVWAEPGMTFNWFGKAVLLLIVLASSVPGVWLAGAFFVEHVERGTGSGNWRDFAESVNVWVRVVGTLVACLTLLGVAVRAASSISGERERDTWDNLLTAPVESDSILRAKWLGSVLSVRWAWLWLCLVWVLGSATGGLYGPAVPWLLLSWAVYAGFLAVLGLWFSMTCRTTLRATDWTLLTAAAVGVGHWYLWLVFCLPLQTRGAENGFTWLVRFQMYGLTPPLSLAWLAFRGEDVTSGVVGTYGAEDPMAALACLVVGLALWSAAAYVLWRRAARRFRVLTGRVPIPVPVGPPPDMGQASDRPEADDKLETGPTKRRPRRRLRLLIGLLGGVALLALGWGVYCGVSADLHLRRALEEVGRTDPGWQLPDIEAAREVMPPAENSAPVVLAVAGRIPRWSDWPTTQLANRVNEMPPQVRLSAADHRGITNDLEDVEEALLLVAPLADMPRGRYPVNWSRDYIGTLMPHLDAGNRVRQLLWYDVVLRAEEADPDGALVACRRLLNLGRSLGDEPMMISQMQRNLGARSAVRGAQRVLAQGEPTDAALADLQRRLADEETHPGLLIGVRGERAGMDTVMALIQAGELSWQDLVGYSRPRYQTGRETLDALSLSLTPGAEKENRAALLLYNTEFIAAAKLPAEEQGPAFARLEARQWELPPLARQLTAFGQSLNGTFRAGRAELRCAVVALAAERFRRRNGRWPGRLDELAPDYLATVPADPFDGAPLRLRRLPDGMVIYSVGPDGQDDGGDVAGVPDTNRTGKDLGFRLWDVAHRRQEPPAAAGRPGD
jgi:ABC-type transport system involved in multi-copper enzyme maturation permease subunit